MVYDGTNSGFNDLAWVPNPGLPSVKALLCGIFPTSWMVDLDIGEKKLNFMLDLDARKYVGVDVTNMFPEETSANQKFFWVHWYRCAMGSKPSPNHTTRAILFSEDFLLGNLKLMSNPFQYSSVCLDLPGTGEYKPRKSWYSVLDQGGDLSSILAI